MDHFSGILLRALLKLELFIRERAFGDTAIILRQEIRMFLQQDLTLR